MFGEDLFVGEVEFFEFVDFVDEFFAGEEGRLFFVFEEWSQLLAFFESFLVNSFVGFAFQIVAINLAFINFRDLAVEIVQIVFVLLGYFLEGNFFRISYILFIFHHIIINIYSSTIHPSFPHLFPYSNFPSEFIIFPTFLNLNTS